MVIPSLHTFIFHCFIFDSQSLEQWGKPPSSGTAFKSVGTASKLTKDIQYCDSLWLSGKSWKNGCGIDKRNLSGNNRFIFIICLKGVLYCWFGESECTHKHDFSIQSHYVFIFLFIFCTDTASDTHCRQSIACYVKTDKEMFELFKGWRSLEVAVLLISRQWWNIFFLQHPFLICNQHDFKKPLQYTKSAVKICGSLKKTNKFL